MAIRRDLRAFIVGGVAAAALVGAAGASFAATKAVSAPSEAGVSAEASQMKITIVEGGAKLYSSVDGKVLGTIPAGVYNIISRDDTSDWIQIDGGWLWKSCPDSNYGGTA